MEDDLRTSLVLDYDKAAKKICSFISDCVAAAAAEGAAVGISGGLDSAVVAFLCVRALGLEKVIGMFLPERDTALESAGYAQAVAAKLGIRLDTIDLTPALTALRCYRGAVPTALKSRLIGRAAVGALRAVGYKNPFELTLFPGESAVLKEAVAFFRLKHRLRMGVLYHRAEREGMLVAGCLNRTEQLTGFLCATVTAQPTWHLFYTFTKARCASLPPTWACLRQLSSGPPSPDLIPGFTDELALGITYEMLDPVLVGLNKGRGCEDIARELKVSPLVVQKIADMVSLASNLGHDVAWPNPGGGSGSQG